MNIMPGPRRDLTPEAERIRQHIVETAQMLVQEEGLSVEGALDRVMDKTDLCDLLILAYVYGDTVEGAIAEELRAVSEKDGER